MSRATRFQFMFIVPVIFVAGFVFGLQLAMTRTTMEFVQMAIYASLASYLLLEFTMFIGAFIIGLCLWMADRWVEFYDVVKPLGVPKGIQEYWHKKRERAERRRMREEPADGKA